MIKKNQFALIFLTIVTMLAVWYVKAPISANGDNNESIEGVSTSNTGRLEALTAMRETLRDERSAMAASYDKVIADENASLTAKADALSSKKALSSLTEKEVAFEIQVINLGYRDSFVHVSDNGIEIIVISEEESASAANEIILMAMEYFDNQYDNVVISFSTATDIVKS